MEDPKTQQQIVDKIKSSTNILVTVSRDPSVDELSAALGLTALLDKLDKHATAIFSGAIPPAITFLDPEKTFENTADSLRDFIIALNKEKADHLRYKVEGDVVKIFITPYRTTITSDDLEFSQGDYNVELVLALGVESQANLDAALEAHGRILHDATVATLSAGTQASSLGSIDWRDATASSFSEMIMSIGDQLKADKPLIDEQIATALLTGIVASTDRFSNPKTTSRVMTMAAQLMAAGADQQLIAAKLQESHEIATPPVANSGETVINEGPTVNLGAESTLPNNDNLSIDHTSTPKPNETTVQPPTESTLPPESSESTLPPETAPETPVVPDVPVSTPDLTSPTSTLAPTSTVVESPQAPGPSIEPSLGGTLNATSEQAAEDAKNAMLDDQNKTILTHSYLDPNTASTSPINGASQSVDEEKPVDIFAKPVNAIEPQQSSEGGSTLPPASESARDHDDARAAVDAALGGAAQSPATAEMPFNLPPPPPPLPDFSTLPPPLPDFSAPASNPTTQPEKLGDIFAPQPTPQPTPPPQPAFSPPVPTPPSLPPQPVGNVASDPSQFHIPGQ
ncbi:MAG TPA: hypothetical protein PKC86_00375 [Candidatus Saccharibacteria bacterium]|nr:hypothetical protein [Candidatus Saccharibacteria bacterium]